MKSPSYVVVKSKDAAVCLSLASHGSIVSFIDPKCNREMAKVSEPSPLFRLTFNDGKSASCMAADAEKVHCVPWSNGQDHGVKITFSGFRRQPIEVVCTIFSHGDDGPIHFGFEASMPDGVVLENVAYPMMAVCSPLKNDAVDSFVAGDAHACVRHPALNWKTGMQMQWAQPSPLAVGFGCYYDAAGGVYAAAYDGKCRQKTLFAKKTASGLTIGWQCPAFQTGRFVLPYSYVFDAFSAAESGCSADWRDAADLYKAWAVKQPWCKKTFANRDDLPKWLKQGPAMVRFTRPWLAQPESIKRWFRDYWQREFPPQTPLIVAYWGWEKTAKWVGPPYFPAYPSDEQFVDLIRFGRKLGVHAFLWPSSYNYCLCYGKQSDGGFLLDQRDQRDLLAKHAEIRPDGTPAINNCVWLRGGQHCRLCPGDPWTREWLNQIAVDCVRRGVELVQLDQAGPGDVHCCSRKHEHPTCPGAWPAAASQKQMETMSRECRAIEPDAIFGYEFPSEWLLQQIGFQDYRDCEAMWQGNESASVLDYVYHEYMPALFQSNRFQRGYDPYGLAWCIVHGQMPCLAARTAIGPGPMIVNGGFERYADEGPFEFVRTLCIPGDRHDKTHDGETTIDPVNPHSGKVCLKLCNHWAGGSAMAMENYDTTKAFRPGRTYRFSVWMRSRQIAKPNGVVLQAFASGGRPIQNWTLSYPPNEANWTLQKIDFRMPSDTTVLRIQLLLEGLGSVWLDDLKMEEVLPDGSLSEVRRPPLPADHELMRQWITLYQGRGRDYLLLGKMLHPPKLTFSPTIVSGENGFPSVLGNAFESPDGSRAVILVNWTQKPQTVDATWNKRTRTVVLKPSEIRLMCDW